MNIQTEHLDNHRVRLTVEVAPDRVEKAMQAAARRIAQQVNIPGFRKGKAPYNIVIQKFGERVVLDEALETLGNDIYKEALDEAKIDPYAAGSLENVEDKPTLKLTFSVPKRPETELGNYREIRMPFEVKEVEDKDVTDTIQRMLDQQALVETVTRPLQIGDLVILDIFGEAEHPHDEAEHAEPAGGEGENSENKEAEAKAETVEAKAEGEAPEAAVEPVVEPVEAAAGEEAAADGDDEDDVKPGQMEDFIEEDKFEFILTDDPDKDLVPGFSAQLVGLSTGEEKKFSIQVPKDYERGFANHRIDFDLEVKEVKSRTLPALNDDFAKRVTQGEVETLLDLRIKVRKDLQEAAQRSAEDAYADKMVGEVVKQVTIKYPEEMVEEFIDQVLDNLDRNLRERGLSLAEYQKIQNKTDEALRADFRDSAIERLKRALVLGKIVEVEKLSVSESDVMAHIDKLSAEFGAQADTFKKMLLRPQSLQGIENDMITERALKRLVAIGRGENPPIEETPASEEKPASEASAAEAAAPVAPVAENAEASTEEPTEAKS